MTLFEQKINLASDNWSPAHPSIIEAIAEANEGNAPAYGGDTWTEEAQQIIQNVLGKVGKVLMVPNGTGANVLAFKLSCRRHESVICTDIAHIECQESGASESIAGCKLLTVPHQGGKMTPEAVIKRLRQERALGKHGTAPRVLSLTQPTEVGTLYQVEELRALSKLCQEEHLLLHVDGSRIYNAAVSLHMSLEEMIDAMQVDILALGGTKNGLLDAEAIVIFNPQLQEGSDHVHKQTLQLISKMRYLSAQYLPFFKNNLWKRLAEQANQKAVQIASIIRETPHLSLCYPVDTNQVFFNAPACWIPLIQEKISCHVWSLESRDIRFVASWNTSEEEVKKLQMIFSQISRCPIS